MKNSKVFRFILSHRLILAIITLGTFLRLFKLSDLMMFIGDFAWFYISARDMVLHGNIPLVGIASSQTWLHQGPWWTYMLAPVLWVFSFNPLSGGYLAVLLGIITIWAVYKTGEVLFSKNVGIVAAFLYASSPLVVIFSRMPYHTSPIPLFSVLFIFFTYKWAKHGWSYFPFVAGTLAFLYNFELASVAYIPVIGILLVSDVLKRHKIKAFFKRKTLFLTAILTGIPMIPVLIYDANNGFLQTVKFAHWTLFLRIMKPLFEGNIGNSNFEKNTSFYFENFTRFIFLESGVISFIILCSMIVAGGLYFVKNKKIKIQERVILLSFVIPFLAFFFNDTRSDAYLPVLFPSIAILIACSFYYALSQRNHILFAMIFVIGIINSYGVIKNNYLMNKPGGYGMPFSERMSVAQEILKNKRTEQFALVGGMANKDYKTDTLPYEYLLWWKGTLLDAKSQNRVIIYEGGRTIKVQYETEKK